MDTAEISCSRESRPRPSTKWILGALTVVRRRVPPARHGWHGGSLVVRLYGGSLRSTCGEEVEYERVRFLYVCGAHREPATRDNQGRPLCPNCLIGDPGSVKT
jgi:hypothetical protein